MRQEAIWLVQFLFVVGALAAVFGSGVYVGWRRRGQAGGTSWDGVPSGIDVRVTTGRSDLFAPEVDVRRGAEHPHTRTVDIRGELTAGG
jgi:hypothetical protein